MSISKPVKAIALGGFFALLVPLGAANAQTVQDDPDMADVARTPLEDFNIDSEDVPEILLTAAENPYDDTGITNCNAVVQEIAALDNVLGPDFDIPQEEASRISAGRVAKSVIGSFVPFRGIVREVSGANKKRNERRLAITAGMVRRAYLKGMGEARGCAYPARPREPGTEMLNAGSSNIPPNIERDAGDDPNQDTAPNE
ncbi:hypothetical protein EH31_02810 [Erythrobacter longus]|uniref:Uncharacterized protein n=1 Tax=Erythrobacter longus TaxID=1044 RepID=A0A074MIG8_ERYLO|nr:hypothetical protein [Erythrobacter longus]KEO91618.1 hypothetical protein EH31_02810 [Erythrobacter longus]